MAMTMPNPPIPPPTARPRPLTPRRSSTLPLCRLPCHFIANLLGSDLKGPDSTDLP